MAYPSLHQARRALEALKVAGFSSDNVGILTHDKDGDTEVKSLKDLSKSEAGKAAGVGAAVGTGGGAVWALGIAAGVLPAIGPVIAGGVLSAIIASAAGGAVVGGVVGALTGMGMSTDDAEYLYKEIEAGRTVVVAQPGEDKVTEAREILLRHEGWNRTHQTHAPRPQPAASNTAPTSSFV